MNASRVQIQSQVGDAGWEEYDMQVTAILLMTFG